MLFEEIYCHIGAFKSGQISLYITVMISVIFAGWHHISIIFLAAELPHWCYVTELQNLTFDLQKFVAVPDTHGEYDHCRVFDLNYSNYTVDDFLNWNRTAIIKSGVGRRGCNNVWVYETSTFTLTAVNQWDLVCDRAYMVSLIQSVYMGGVMVGCLAFGQLSDRVGRMRTLVLVSFFWSLCAVGAALVPFYVAFVALRFCVGALAGGSFTTAFVICIEVIGASYRTEAGIFVQAWFSIGIMSLSAIAYVVPNFVNLQLIIGVLPVLGVSYYWLVPESPRWLVTQHRDEEAEDVLRKLAKRNKSALPQPLKLEDNRSGEKGDKKAVLFDLLKTPRLRMMTIFMWIAWFTSSIVYYGLSLGISLLKGSLFFNSFLSGLVEIPSFFLTVYAMRYVGRRWLTVITFLGAGLFNLLSVPFLKREDMEVTVITLMMLGKAFGAANFAILYIYSAELFPTVVRNVGVGSSSMMARVGGLLQPQVALIGKTWTPAPFLVYGILSVIGAMLSFGFPETHKKILPETLEEAENFGRLPHVEDVFEDGKETDKLLIRQPKDNLQ